MIKKNRFFLFLYDISAWISLPHYNPFSSWSFVTVTADGKKKHLGYSYLSDNQTDHLYLYEPSSMVRQKHALLLLADVTVHAIGIPVTMMRDLLCFGAALAYALFYLLCLKFSQFLACLQLLAKLAISMAAKPLAWIGMLACNTFGVLFLPYGCRKVYASLERDVYQDSLIAPCFQPILDRSAPSRKPHPIRFFSEPQKNTPLNSTGITHLFGGKANQAGW